jgi:hypothetical protein
MLPCESHRTSSTRPPRWQRRQSRPLLNLALDLLIDLGSMSHGIFHSMVPDTATQYRERKEYYALLRTGNLPVRAVAEREFKFLCFEHSNYVPPSNEPIKLFGL